MAVDADGNGYACGTSSVGPAIWKIDSRGNLVWRKTQSGGAAYDSFLYGLVIAPDENIYAVGEFYAAEVQLDQFVISKFGDTPSSSTGFIAKLAADPPSIRPELVSGQLRLSWPTNQPDFRIESNTLNLNPGGWQALSTDVWDGRNVVTNLLDQPGRVFRLKRETAAP